MKITQTSNLAKRLSIATCGLILIAPASFAAITFSVSQSDSPPAHPTDVGKITVTSNGLNSVNVKLQLLDGYGILNTGGPHTPFSFTLASETGVTADFIKPLNGEYVGLYGSQPAMHLVLNLTGGNNNPWGNYGVAIDSLNGSGNAVNGAPGAYYGELSFNLLGTGLTEDSFIANPDGYYFAADIISPTGATGSSSWKTRDPRTPNDTPGVPDGGTTLVLLGGSLLGLGSMRRFMLKNA